MQRVEDSACISVAGRYDMEDVCNEKLEDSKELLLHEWFPPARRIRACLHPLVKPCILAACGDATKRRSYSPVESAGAIVIRRNSSGHFPPLITELCRVWYAAGR